MLKAMNNDKHNYHHIPIISLGKVYATPSAHTKLSISDIQKAICRHIFGDWGNVGEDDWLANDQASLNGGRILSSYKSSKGITFWIITELDHAMTTILLPEDY